ncbi:Beta-parvin [Oryzias melastigma]|uniref:Beta-parvin n=1 Tax=Oryzias melastigma TaxID=30732 RepID=A0A834BXS5_ORYME|nr:Beta-parvin [Oryzias melastigma]
MQSSKMKKDESFLGKLGGSLARKKKSKEEEACISLTTLQSVCQQQTITPLQSIRKFERLFISVLEF